MVMMCTPASHSLIVHNLMLALFFTLMEISFVDTSAVTNTNTRDL